MAKSIRHLAALVGKSPSAVRKWTRRKNWPFELEPPWDATQVRVWAQIYVKRDPAAAYRQKVQAAAQGMGEFRDDGPLTRARTLKTNEQALREKQRRLVEEGKAHDVEECRIRRVGLILQAKARLTELPRCVAQRLAGQDAAVVAMVEQVLTEEIDNILAEFNRGHEGTD